MKMSHKSCDAHLAVNNAGSVIEYVCRFGKDDREGLDIKMQAKKLKEDIPALFLALKDNETPMIAKIFAGITVAYALSPIDLIPDFIPILGYLDDIIILPLLVALTIKFIPDDVLQNNREQSADMWKDGKPKKWYYAIPIVLIWIMLIGVIVKMVL